MASPQGGMYITGSRGWRRQGAECPFLWMDLAAEASTWPTTATVTRSLHFCVIQVGSQCFEKSQTCCYLMNMDLSMYKSGALFLYLHYL